MASRARKSNPKKLSGFSSEADYRRYAIVVSDQDLHEASLKLTAGTIPGTAGVSAPKRRGVR